MLCLPYLNTCSCLGFRLTSATSRPCDACLLAKQPSTAVTPSCRLPPRPLRTCLPCCCSHWCPSCWRWPLSSGGSLWQPTCTAQVCACMLLLPSSAFLQQSAPLEVCRARPVLLICMHQHAHVSSLAAFPCMSKCHSSVFLSLLCGLWRHDYVG